MCKTPPNIKIREYTKISPFKKKKVKPKGSDHLLFFSHSISFDSLTHLFLMRLSLPRENKFSGGRKGCTGNEWVKERAESPLKMRDKPS